MFQIERNRQPRLTKTDQPIMTKESVAQDLQRNKELEKSSQEAAGQENKKTELWHKAENERRAHLHSLDPAALEQFSDQLDRKKFEIQDQIDQEQEKASGIKGWIEKAKNWLNKEESAVAGARQELHAIDELMIDIVQVCVERGITLGEKRGSAQQKPKAETAQAVTEAPQKERAVYVPNSAEQTAFEAQAPQNAAPAPVADATAEVVTPVPTQNTETPDTNTTKEAATPRPDNVVELRHSRNPLENLNAEIKNNEERRKKIEYLRRHPESDAGKKFAEFERTSLESQYKSHEIETKLHANGFPVDIFSGGKLGRDYGITRTDLQQKDIRDRLLEHLRKDFEAQFLPEEINQKIEECEKLLQEYGTHAAQSEAEHKKQEDFIDGLKSADMEITPEEAEQTRAFDAFSRTYEHAWRLVGLPNDPQMTATQQLANDARWLSYSAAALDRKRMELLRMMRDFRASPLETADKQKDFGQWMEAILKEGEAQQPAMAQPEMRQAA